MLTLLSQTAGRPVRHTAAHQPAPRSITSLRLAVPLIVWLTVWTSIGSGTASLQAAQWGPLLLPDPAALVWGQADDNDSPASRPATDPFGLEHLTGQKFPVRARPESLIRTPVDLGTIGWGDHPRPWQRPIPLPLADEQADWQPRSISTALATRQLLRIESWERRRTGKPDLTLPDFLIHCDAGYRGTLYDAGAVQRLLAVRLVLVNRSADDITIPRNQLRLHLGDVVRPWSAPPATQQERFFPGVSGYVKLLKTIPPEMIVIPRGSLVAGWWVVTGLPADLDDDSVELALTQPALGQSRWNLFEQQTAVLGLRVERLGPRQSLAVLSCEGPCNSFNFPVVASELERLHQQERVQRAVFAWPAAAVKVSDQPLLNWLRNSLYDSGNTRTGHEAFPPFPTGFAELHLAGLPGTPANAQQADGTGESTGLSRLHLRTSDAVIAALRFSCHTLPLDELITELRRGHVDSRTAVLLHAADRLRPDDLSVVLAACAETEPKIQYAALLALGSFANQPVALSRLTAACRPEAAGERGFALESLARSRFSLAHERLLELFWNADSASRRLILQTCVRFPRPVWAPALAAVLETGPISLHAEALRGLSRLGHPELLRYLEQALNSADPTAREVAFELLLDRTDDQSEQLAFRYVEQHLATRPPTAAMMTFLSRQRDPRVIDWLRPHYRSAEKLGIIGLMGALGDQRTASWLAGQYRQASDTSEKTAILQALKPLRAPELPRLAADALEGNDHGLANAACQALLQSGTREALSVLYAAPRRVKSAPAMSAVCHALANLGTAEARSALVGALSVENRTLRQPIRQALQSLRLKSPSLQLIHHARQLVNDQKWNEALELLDLAVNVDPSSPDALGGRGFLRYRAGQYDQAGEDFRAAIALDPTDRSLLAGLTLVDLRGSDPAAALNRLEISGQDLPGDALGAYHSARAFAVAISLSSGQLTSAALPETLQRLPPADRLRRSLLDELKKAQSSGSQEIDLPTAFAKEADFDSVRQWPEVLEIVGPSR